MSWFCSPWNPYPIQAQPGLLNDRLAPYESTYNRGAFDRPEVPPMFLVPGRDDDSGRILLRSLSNSGGTGAIKNAQKLAAQELFGERVGEAMWLEEERQEFLWNRNGVGNPGGLSQSWLLWSEFPGPYRRRYAELLEAGEIEGPEDFTDYVARANPAEFAQMFLATNMPHYGAGYDEGQEPPPLHSWTAWLHVELPVEQGFDPNLFDEFGYSVWAAECIPFGGAFPWGRYQSPDPLQRMILRGRSRKAKTALEVVPYWF